MPADLRGRLAAGGLACLAAGLIAGCGGGEGHPRIAVDLPGSLLDAPVAIQVDGLRPHQRVVVRARRAAVGGTPWSSSATFAADGRGVVDVARDPSLGGTYRGRHEMGLFWSMRPVGSGKHGELLDPPPGRDLVRLAVLARGRVVAQRRIVRATAAPGVRVTELRPDRAGFYGEFFAVPGRGRRPGVLVLGGSKGGLTTAGEAALLASHGDPALALAYFGEPGLPRGLKEVPLEYFARALRWLARRPGVDPSRIAVIGISRGSEAAQLLGVHYPHLVRAVVGYVPSGVVNAGLGSPQGLVLHASAWSFHGHPIPYARLPFFGVPGSPFTRRAVIPDWRVRGSILLVSGGRDSVWPSSGYAKAIMARLDAHRFRFSHRRLDYPDAGHLVGAGIPNLAIDCPRGICPGGGTAVGDALGRRDSWAALLRFLAGLSPR